VQKNNSRCEFVVVFVWQTWCKHCLKTFGPIIDTTKAFKSKVHTLAITSNSEEEIERFLANNKLNYLDHLCNTGSFSIGVDESKIIKELQNGFEVRTIPHVYVVKRTDTRGGDEVVWEGHPTGLESVLGWYLNDNVDSDTDSD